ncbi:hypothetical protein JCM30760_07830 [Thiomicrorhabdus hydrogeniphila]
MDIYERIKKIRKTTKMSQPEFSIFCGLKGNEISSLENRKQKASNETLEKIGEKYPEYRIWLLTGEEFEEKGHISPMTKLESEKQKVS